MASSTGRRPSIDQDEIAHFARDSRHWWDENGPFRPLHRLNPTRIGYIRDRICAHFDLKGDGLTPLEGIGILDIGCGGGLACEPLARLGARVTGIDADAQAIDVATAHAAGGGLSIAYRHGAAENLLKGPKFDVVMALEVIEHTAAPARFVESCATLCKPGGLVVFSTLNRTPRSFALGIVAAEYILGWVARGTHDWRKFVKPAELAAQARHAGLEAVDVTGLVFNPLKNQFALSKADMAVNYLMTMEKKR